MALRAPNPRLATETVTHVPRTAVRGKSGDVTWAAGAGVAYPAVATMPVLIRPDIANIPAAVTSKSNWNVLLFAADDPGVEPQSSLLVLGGQGEDRVLQATSKSTQHGVGCWYVIAEETA